MEFGYLIRGLPGHPLHPPLTDATIGIYTGATVFGLLSVIGVSETNTATAWWLALVAGLVVTVPTALSGLADWGSIVFVHGMRVLNLMHEPAHRATAPLPTPEKKVAAGESGTDGQPAAANASRRTSRCRP